MRKILGILGAAFIAANSYGAFSIQLDAGQLRGAGGATLPSDNIAPHSGGALLIFISAGADGIFETPTQLTAGSWVAGDDVLLSLNTDATSGSGFDTSGGTNETLNQFAINTASAPQNQPIGLMWFPAITYSQWLSGTLPVGGMKFGFYNPGFYGNGSSNPDTGSSWIVPAAGNLVNLNFFTTDSSGGGTQNPLEGWAQFTVNAVPEPSTFALIAIGAAVVPFLRRRKA